MMQLAKVVAGNPDSNTVDIILSSTGEPHPDVTVLSPSAGTRFGHADIPQPAPPPSGDKWDLDFNFENDVLAVVAYLGSELIVIGFIYPEVSQMLFKEQRAIRRHESDLYESIDSEGNYELSHPSGTYIRIGTTPEHEDLTGKDADEKWAIEKNTDKAVNLHLAVFNAGVEKASINIDPAGEIAITTTANVTLTATKVTIDGEADIKGNATLNSDGAPLGNIVTTQSTCAFTGGPHPVGSSSCKAGG